MSKLQVNNKKKFNSRKLMELAVKVMNESVQEPRKNGKDGPAVGAVLWKPDGRVETAFRGELRHGDHAEYTLLERKNRGNKLDGSVLFTTLEPCAPGSRRHPKLGCAERIVLARIKEVWIGLEDPDPTVDRKGIKYLQDNNVSVHIFDRDLQKLILKKNQGFLEQARIRAEEKEKPKGIILSRFEDTEYRANLRDFSSKALNIYRKMAGIKFTVGSNDFNYKLFRQGILRKKKNIFVPTGFGILLFGDKPRDLFPQAGLQGTVHYENEQTEIKDFNEPIIMIPFSVTEWLKKILPLTINRSTIQRTQMTAFPDEVVREAVINAIVHRDYNITGAKCHLIITKDTVSVRSPGYPVSPITLEDLQFFRASSLSRNPELFYILSQMEMVEERGFGMETWKSLPEKYDLPLPKYTFESPYLTLTFYRSIKGIEHTVESSFFKKLNKDEKKGWLFLTSKMEIAKREYADHFGYNDRKVQRHLKRFIDLGLIVKVGAGPATKYKVIRK